MLFLTACSALLVGLGSAAPAADPAGSSNSIVIGTVTFHLPQGWVNWTATKCPDQGRCSFQQAGQNWLECSDDSACKKTTGSSPDISPYCSGGPSADCLNMLRDRYGLDLRAEAGRSADPTAKGVEAGDRDAGKFFMMPDLPAPPENTPPAAAPHGASGGARDDPGLAYIRAGWSGSRDPGLGGTIDTIVETSPFLNHQMSLYPSGSASRTDLRALGTVGSEVINPISQRVLRDGASGRAAFDGQSADLPPDAPRKCGAGLFGVGDCAK